MKKEKQQTSHSSGTMHSSGTEVALPENEVVLYDGAWGAGDTLDSNDLLVGKIYHQQALSKFVEDGLATPGDWCDSLTGEVIAKKDEALSVIIFSSFKKFLIYKAGHAGGVFEFQNSEDVTSENCNLPWLEETADGVIKRYLQYNYFCLLPNKVNDLPYVLSMSSTKIRTAKKLNTMIAKLARIKKPSAAYCFDILTIKETGDKGSWFGIDVVQGRMTSKIELQLAHEWYEQLKKSKVKIVESEENAEEVNYEETVGQQDLNI